ncbi:unnamed protein product [Prunus armeniaca]|uniref:Uncharacterized protein n=1 Tax=Prunus armeniaca TaxID=36596 RepID=A0A6J5V5K7_PRUAR|nr:unnamed protein product [Prunus armeniaca]
MVTASENTSSTLTVPTPKKSNTTRLVQTMIGSIPVNIYPTDFVLMTSTSETSEENQKDNFVENAKVQGAKPPSSPKAYAVESTSQEVYPCSFKGKSKVIIMKKKLVQKVKTTDVLRDQIPYHRGQSRNLKIS